VRRLRCSIGTTGRWYSNLFLDHHAIACAAVLSRYGDSPVLLEVRCDNITSPWLGEESEFLLEVSWTGQLLGKAERLRATLQAKPLVEMASVALALVLAHRVANLGQLDVTEYGERADYRSVTAECVLEISGTEAPGELGRRHREKVAQAVNNPLGWDAYVVVCAFSHKGHQVRFSAHSWRGERNGEEQG
jgi:hypothetical protein